MTSTCRASATRAYGSFFCVAPRVHRVRSFIERSISLVLREWELDEKDVVKMRQSVDVHVGSGIVCSGLHLNREALALWKAR